MPEIDMAAVPARKGSGHLPPFDVCTGFPKVGSRNPQDLTTCSDVDMMSSNADGRFVHKDGIPYPAS